jgi:hypothetical protein
MRVSLLALAVIPFLASTAGAQLVAAPDASPIGTWRGTSRCVVRQPGCEEAAIVYRIALKGRNDSLAIETRKVVDGREEDAGLLACLLNASRAYITCAVPEGKWRMRVRHDSLVGQMRLRDGTWLLDVQAVRSPEGPR